MDGPAPRWPPWASAVLAGTLAPQPALDRATHAIFGGPPPGQARMVPPRPGGAGAVPSSPGPLAPPPSAAPAQPPAPEAAPGEPGGLAGLLAGWRPAIDLEIGHVLGFALLAGGLALAFPSAPLAGLFAGIVLLGAATEAVQSFYISRTAEWIDLGRDTAGAAAGLVLALAWRRLRTRHAMGHNAGS